MKRGMSAYTILAAVLGVLAFGALGWAQKSKPQPPPAPAPDPAIVYTYGTGAYSVLAVINADGTNKKELMPRVNGVFNTRPDWSPDGKKIVFVDNALGPTAVTIVNVDGSGLTHIMELNDSWGPLAWSPMPLADGRSKIAFCDKDPLPDGGYGANNDLFLVNIDGTGRVRLTDTPNVDEGFMSDGAISWSPLGDHIAVTTWDDVLVYQVAYSGGTFTATLVGGLMRVPGSVIEGCQSSFDVDWANTLGLNKALITTNPPSGSSSFDLWAVDVFAPQNVFRLTSTPLTWERECSWSPDDARVAYVQGPSGGIWVINSDGTGAKQIVAPIKRIAYGRPQWRRNIY
jgi:Tol biopolymer transport system component